MRNDLETERAQPGLQIIPGKSRVSQMLLEYLDAKYCDLHTRSSSLLLLK